MSTGSQRRRDRHAEDVREGGAGVFHLVRLAAALLRVARRLPASSVRAAQAAEVVSQLVERLNQLHLPRQGQPCPLAMEGLRPLEELLTGEELAVNLDFDVPSA